MRIDIEHIRSLLSELSTLNQLKPSEIEWYWEGKPMIFSEKEIEDWRWAGMSNTAFVECVIGCRIREMEVERDGRS